MIFDRALFTLYFTGVLNVFLRDAAAFHDNLMFTVPFQGKPLDRFSGFGNSVNDSAGPAHLNSDHDDRGDVRVAARADQRPEVQVEISAKLQTAIMMRQGDGAFHIVGDFLTGGIRQIVERQDYDMIADTDPAVFAAITVE